MAATRITRATGSPIFNEAPATQMAYADVWDRLMGAAASSASDQVHQLELELRLHAECETGVQRGELLAAADYARMVAVNVDADRSTFLAAAVIAVAAIGGLVLVTGGFLRAAGVFASFLAGIS